MYPATTGAKQRMIITENYHYRCDHLPRWHLAGRALVQSAQIFDYPPPSPTTTRVAGSLRTGQAATASRPRLLTSVGGCRLGCRVLFVLKRPYEMHSLPKTAILRVSS